MKKSILFLMSVVASSTIFAQTFSDDFESYSVGSYLGTSSADWTTWSGTEGGAEDVTINNNNASSGNKQLNIVNGELTQ